MDNKKYAVILAAGDGKRMKSDKPKVLAEVLFQPMLRWVLDACVRAQIPAENVNSILQKATKNSIIK